MRGRDDDLWSRTWLSTWMEMQRWPKPCGNLKCSSHILHWMHTHAPRHIQSEVWTHSKLLTVFITEITVKYSLIWWVTEGKSWVVDAIPDTPFFYKLPFTGSMTQIPGLIRTGRHASNVKQNVVLYGKWISAWSKFQHSSCTVYWMSCMDSPTQWSMSERWRRLSVSARCAVWIA